MIDTSVFATSFLASAVEIIEMVITVVGVGAMRGWRSTLLGAGAGLVILAALILGLGTALTLVPVRLLRVLVGSLLFVFGLQWLRKGNRRVSVSGLRGMGARAATDDDIPTHGMDCFPIVVSRCSARGSGSHDNRRHVRRRRVRLVHHVAPSASRTRKSEVNHVAFLAAPRKTRAHSLAPGLRDVLVRVHHRGRLDRCRGGGSRIICDLGAARRGRGIVVDTAGSGSGGDRSQPSSHQRLNVAEPAPRPNQRLIT